MAENTPLLPRTKPQNRRKRVAPASPKLGTFDGVYLLTSLNVLSILMFLRFGFIVGQMGIMGSVLLLVMSYLINVLTVLSISAISTNGTVKGGGAYYMISRSLGPEFGGAIGLIFFVGQILNASLNVVGFIEPLLVNFGAVQGDIFPLLPVSRVWELAYSTLLLAMCTGVAIVGLSLVSKTALWLFVLLTLSTLSIPVSALVVPAGHPLPAPWDGLKYTGISWATTLENLWPQFTSGAVGSVQPPGVPETFCNMFGIFFPATAGIFAGSSMSGDLKTPSRLIPKGTLYGLLTSFVLYLLVIVSLGVSTPRELLHRDIKVIQSINMNGLIIIIGEVSTSLFSVIMGVVGAASMLNAIADDRIIPGLSAFATRKKRPHEKRRAELLSILLTWLLAQVFLFADINQIAIFITMAFLMTFLVTNLACFLLRLGSAPNFRPSFKYFNSKTAFTGGLTSVIAMYICDGVSATSAIVFLVFLIMMIHYSTPPLNFGDILQLLIYHQVRKYLLRLKLQMSVKYWRPQILLLCDDPQTSWNLIGFCNHLKKGGLYILGHVVLLDDHSSSDGVSSEFNISSFKEIRKQKNAWLKLRDLAKIKAFVQIAIGPSLPWGVRNVFLGSGLGGMKPNITVIGFYDFHKHGVELPMNQSHLQLPTDDCRKEKKVSVNQWVQIVEDLVIMQATVAVAANFRDMKLPIFEKLWIKSKMSKMGKKPKKYIDLYPIQMSTICLLEDGKSVMSTNFDTYTLILQLGLILSTVDEWEKNGYVLRIIAFVETTAEQEDERQRLGTLLESLRIDAEVKIVCFDSENLPSYNLLVKGHDVTTDTRAVYEHIKLILNTDQWWINMVEGRKALRDLEAQKRPRKGNHKSRAIVIADDLSNRLRKLTFTSKSPSEGTGRGKSLKNNRRYTLSNLHEQGLSLSLNMKAQGDGLFFKYDGVLDSSDDSDTEKDYIKEDVASHASSVLNQQGIVRPQSSGYASTAATQKSSPSPKLEMLLPKTPDQLSIRASRSNLRPNFLAGKIPHSKIRDDADDAEADEDSENAKPSIEFVEEAEHSEEDDDGDDIEDDHQMHLDTGPEKVKDAENIYKDGPLTSSLTHSLAETNRAGLKATSRRAIQGKKGQSVHFNPQFEQAGTQTPSILTNDGIHEHLQSPGFREDDEGLSLSSREMSTVNLREGTSGLSRENKLTYRLLQKELELLSFSDLPAKGQHIILNELMKKISKTDDTAVIFSTLPAPAIGSHLDDEESLAYTNSLAIWLDGLAPVLLLNSQTVTVTTSL
ncbi:hypothetical protein METBIDRAFT_62367 [Metschnikowia bicuspidata var. bicuspidata NRRL YB-4993]|uniref:Amino acid permease/ SLC12A domain-containing protein n=1 Tax=Metschnikowia bicuspidata var. bicuspidata NRRL YB-4993 TaxID=869754 RepID=A0A1A0HFV0_9ASCO|nr:hypothetical protein METBIDRAFT_62367 [Metschnikowia bicuspidata var. bicuspidata NRRL YB-4993]OBA22772.1 hypothetical protein METBIDRAFT_62367 [Metschnikowia bicuspidata var. bicuspidata NRRL YB-4993]